MKDTNVSSKEISDAIDLWILSERARKIAKRRFVDAITHEAIAEEFDMSPTQVKRITKKSKQLLVKHCPEMKDI